jgi:RimJ/RimL family protein N-acetyltransferase
MILQGEKVKLRPMEVNEIPLFYQWATQSDAAIFWYGDGELSDYKIPSYQEFLEDWKSYYFDGSQPEKGRCFVILAGDRPIGQINYNQIERSDNSVEFLKF